MTSTAIGLASRLTVRRAVERGVTFIAGACDPELDGLWQDFVTRAGSSVDWVSGHVVASLAAVAGAHAVCDRATRALRRRQSRLGGWGYNAHIPEDADSTAWVVRALASGDFVQPHAMRSAHAFLVRHIVPGGGYTTFCLLDRIGTIIGERERSALAGWGSAHTCVSANVALALLETGVPTSTPAVRHALDFLEETRDGRGLWRSYWWEGHTFATYLSMLALALGGRLPDDERRRSALALLSERNDDGGWGDGDAGTTGESHAFATACALRALRLARSNADAAAGATDAVQWLTAHQCADGSWPSVPLLRIPDSDVIDPSAARDYSRPGTGIVVADQNRVHTTAAVVHALDAVRASDGEQASAE